MVVSLQMSCSKRNPWAMLTLPEFIICIIYIELIFLAERGTSPHDYRYHLRMWAKEKDARKETIKDLPKMSQVESCWRIYGFKMVSLKERYLER